MKGGFGPAAFYRASRLESSRSDRRRIVAAVPKRDDPERGLQRPGGCVERRRGGCRWSGPPCGAVWPWGRRNRGQSPRPGQVRGYRRWRWPGRRQARPRAGLPGRQGPRRQEERGRRRGPAPRSRRGRPWRPLPPSIATMPSIRLQTSRVAGGGGEDQAERLQDAGRHGRPAEEQEAKAAKPMRLGKSGSG
jgi:hypothetical protein